MSSDDTTPGKLDALAKRVSQVESTAQRIDAAVAANTERVERIEASIAENTTITRTVAKQLPEIKEMLTVYTQAKTTGSVLTRLLRWAGGVGAAIAGIWAALHVGSGK